MAFPRPQRVPPRRLGDLATRLGVATGAPAVEVSGVTLDSRSVQPGDLYAALPGSNVHGARFAGAAAAAGAVALLTDAPGADLAESTAALPTLVVPDPRSRLGELAAYLYGNQPPRVGLVGITGTNGKTTTAYLVDSALRALGHGVGLIGTVETRIGEERLKSTRTTPEATDLHALLACMRERGVDECVMEVSSHALTLHRVDGLVFDVAVFTNLTQDHLDLHGDMERYFAAKASLLTPGRARRGIVCVDDAYGARLARETAIPVTTLGCGPDAGADHRIVAVSDAVPDFVLRGPDGAVPLRSALPGAFNRVNTALAYLVLRDLGIAPVEAAAAVLTDPHVPGRMEPVRVPGDAEAPLAVVDYAHTPDAVAAALAALRPRAAGPLVVVLGAGGDRDQGKRAAMGAAAATGADVVVITDDNPRSEDPAAIRAALLAGARAVGGATRISEVADRREAIRYAVSAARAGGPGAVLAVVGKGHETGQEIAGAVHPFDDRREVEQALAATVLGAPGGPGAPG